MNLNGLENITASIDNWISLLEKALLKCSRQFVTRQMCKWFPILHDKPRKWLVKAVEQVKKSDEYKSNLNENNDNNDNKDDNDNNGEDEKKENNDKEYFDDEMIEKIVELNFDWEKHNAEWVINELIQTTDQCFDFGIYLSNYIVFDENKANDPKEQHRFPQLYIDFMKKHCGISWQLVQPH